MENMSDNVKGNPVGKREALLADRLRLHKGYRYTEVEIFSKGDFTLGTNWFEGEVTVGDVAEFFQRSGDTLYDKLGAGWSWRGAKGEIERARECLEKVLAVRGTTLEEVRTARGRRLLSQDRRMAETMAFLLTDCTFADIAELIGGVPGRVENEVFETYYAASNWNIDEDVQKALHTGIIYYAWNVGNPNRPLCLPPETQLARRRKREHSRWGVLRTDRRNFLTGSENAGSDLRREGIGMDGYTLYISRCTGGAEGAGEAMGWRRASRRR